MTAFYVQVMPNKMLTASHDGTVKLWDCSGIKDEITSFGDEEEEKERKRKEKEERKRAKEQKKKEKKEREKQEKEKKKAPTQIDDKESLPEKNEFEKNEKDADGISQGEKRNKDKDGDALDEEISREIEMINKDMMDL